MTDELQTKFLPTPRINGFIYIRCAETNDLVALEDSKGVLKKKRFKSVSGAVMFIVKMNKLAEMESNNNNKA